jgi:ABC-type antimicrobial peptide transport system permease subunit
MYFPHAQFPARAMNVVVRSAVDPATLTTSIRRVLREVDPDLPMYRVRTMEARVAESLARRRFSTLLLALFAGLALGLAAIGTYGVLAYLVSQGERELAIRLALGATPGNVVRLVVGHGLALAGSGLALGLLAAVVATRFLQSLLFEVHATDVVAFVGVPIGLAAVAGLAALVPALRASRIDPVRALAAE